MLLNHLRQRVAEFREGESLCPLCASPLIAKRGDIVIWHWAHKATLSGRDACPFEESPWHLGCKDAYSRFPGWQIEYPVTIEGQNFILDAFNPTTGRVREFVHSLSPYYEAKHQRLVTHFSDVRWLFDGNVFGSHRRCATRDGVGAKDLLKPRALEIACRLHPRVGVLFPDALVKHWKNNVWYPVTTPSARFLTKELNAATAARHIERARRTA